MITETLQSELLHEFHEERHFLDEQINTLDPLSSGLRSSSVSRTASAAGLLFMQLLLILTGAALVLSVVFATRIYPLYLLMRLRDSNEATPIISHAQAQHLAWLVQALILILALTAFIMAYLVGRIHRKNLTLNRAGRTYKTFMGTLLNRRAKLDAMAQRHNLEMVPPPASEPKNINDIENPGF